ncbi:alcohol dehydrogenase [Rhodococcus sp. Leaf278]|uniref:NDMA-dependent alcohol dehydrogenase n=1 Tax=Rhodococcus sp. Leaf278 TaxID=1736319 RepID=UPI0007096F8C|nr:NDMA-dependent alcohol dehydrogenase [Rhodococcus sp. Leaf278]KQU45900.1 alcohol dehydrogenase [Rhodococcus sp. Leaf278]
MKTRGALLWKPGTNSGWSIEDIDLDPPRPDEVLIELVASGLCHSDAHLDTGDIPLPFAPVLGGHEGAGVIVEAGDHATGLEVGDHVVTTFLPSCGRCRWCALGMSSLCDVGAGVLGGKAPDGTNRIHVDGQPVGAMSFLGTFSPYVVAPVSAVIKVPKEIPLDKAALLGCGVPTGWGSAVYAADTQPGDTVVVVGTGGVGIHAVQGARLAGATTIVAVDPVEFKRETASKLGATHVAESIADAMSLVADLTDGVMADKVILTAGVGEGNLVGPCSLLTRKGGTTVITSAAPAMQAEVSLNLLDLTMSGKRLQGALYGQCNARADIPKLLGLYKRGELMLDELVTNTYSLDDINTGFTDMMEGRNMRGVIVYD